MWDKENVLAIRIFDTGGDGGIYGDKFKMSMADLMDNVSINAEADFSYGDKSSLNKSIKLVATSSYPYKGKLSFIHNNIKFEINSFRVDKNHNNHLNLNLNLLSIN